MRLELTKRADYAIRTVLALARAADDERLSVRRVAADQRVPERFLPQVMRDLVRAGLVDGTVGRAGGYRIAKPPAEISLLDVLEAVEGDSRRRGCILRNGHVRLTASATSTRSLPRPRTTFFNDRAPRPWRRPFLAE